MTLQEKLKTRLRRGEEILMSRLGGWVQRRYRHEEPADRERALHFLRRHFRIIGIRRWKIHWHEDPTTIPAGPFNATKGALGEVLFSLVAGRLFPTGYAAFSSSMASTSFASMALSPHSVYDGAWQGFATAPLGLERQGFLFKSALFHAGEAGLFGFGITRDGHVHALAHPERVHVDQNQRVHNADGPAVVWSTGLGSLYVWHGMMVPPANEWIIASPKDLTAIKVLHEPNAELRRMMVEKFTPARLMQEADAKLLHHDDFGQLWRLSIPNDEALVMVKVVNSTPEPDGSYKDYWLRVPPDTTTARQGVAWTFGENDPKKYQPTVQT